MASSVTHMASQAEFLPVLDGGAHGASMHITRLDQRLHTWQVDSRVPALFERGFAHGRHMTTVRV